MKGSCVLSPPLPYHGSLHSCHFLRATSFGTFTLTLWLSTSFPISIGSCVDLPFVSLTRMPAPNVLQSLLIWPLCLTHNRGPRTCVMGRPG